VITIRHDTNEYVVKFNNNNIQVVERLPTFLKALRSAIGYQKEFSLDIVIKPGAENEISKIL
jgi:hypothetical protein